jgi:hypothetical protein
MTALLGRLAFGSTKFVAGRHVGCMSTHTILFAVSGSLASCSNPSDCDISRKRAKRSMSRYALISTAGDSRQIQRPKPHRQEGGRWTQANRSENFLRSFPAGESWRTLSGWMWRDIAEDTCPTWNGRCQAFFNNPVICYGPFGMFNGICHSRGERKRIHVWIPLLDVIGNVGIKFSAFIKDSPIALF